MHGLPSLKSDNRPTYIYALQDPSEVSQRVYVGKTIMPVDRYRSHVTPSSTRKTIKGKWVASLKARGVKPEMVVLETVPPGGDWEEAERFWIASMKMMGVALANLTSGGENGLQGMKMPGEWVARQSAGRRAQPVRRNAASGYKGVAPSKGRFVARIALPGGGNHHLGTYDTVVEAACAYDRMARELFGAARAMNFPRPGEKSARPGVEPREWELPEVQVRPVGTRRSSTSGVPDVFWYARFKHYRVQKRIDGKRRSLLATQDRQTAIDLSAKCDADPEFARKWISDDKRKNNGHVPRPNKAGFRGVKLERFGRYVARLHLPGGKDKHLGTFDTSEEAARAYDVAAKERWGAAAVLNFPGCVGE